MVSRRTFLFYRGSLRRYLRPIFLVGRPDLIIQTFNRQTSLTEDPDVGVRFVYSGEPKPPDLSISLRHMRIADPERTIVDGLSFHPNHSEIRRVHPGATSQ